jgi:hypothetical protein
VQADVLAEFQEIVTAFPDVTLVGVAVNVTVGDGDTSSPYSPSLAVAPTAANTFRT